MRKFPFNLLIKEFSIFKKLDSPQKVQDFLDAIPINFEKSGRDTCRSPLMVLRKNKAHCIEGAFLSAAALWYHGKKPLLLDLKTTENDLDHVVALFQHKNRWGAISKTNHAVLRYRDPVYKNIRELAMSYFNEIFLQNREKTLHSFSKPFSLLRYGSDWLTAGKDLWHIAEDLDDSSHVSIVERRDIRHLRPVDRIEIRAGNLEEWKKK